MPSVELSWNSSFGADEYRIYRDGTEIGTTSSTSYTDTDDVLEIGETYTYEVIAWRSEGGGMESTAAEEEITIPEPSDFTVSSFTASPDDPDAGDTVEIEWEVTNEGGLGGNEQDISLEIDGSDQTSTTETLEEDETTSGSYTYQIDEGADEEQEAISVVLSTDDDTETMTLSLLSGFGKVRVGGESHDVTELKVNVDGELKDVVSAKQRVGGSVVDLI